VQKKLQEKAMGDDADKLAAGMAGMDMKDDMSMGSSNAETELELLRAQVRHLQGQNNVMAMTTTTLTQQLAETSAAVSLEQQKHNRIISNPVFVSALSAMQGPDLDIDTLWWMVQWGNEYLARFKRDGSLARKKAHDEYKKWTAHTKQKQMAGFTASLRSAAGGDDSLNQSQND
jgi:cytochrome c-type biogenesis protein CcmH/NrfF